ncbi:MAG: FAD-dependent oxidoreductase [Spirochaetota bacterium]
MKRTLLLVGAGHAHLPLIQEFGALRDEGYECTLVSLSRVHYYSGMAPGFLGGLYDEDEIRFPVADMVERAGGTFIAGRAVRIDPRARRVLLADNTQLDYDVLSVSVGSFTAPTISFVQQESESGSHDDAIALVPTKPIAELCSLRSKLAEWKRTTSRVSIAVGGGGAAAVEIAANLACYLSEQWPESSVTLLPGQRLLPGFGGFARLVARRRPEKLGVRVEEGARAISVASDHIATDLGPVAADAIVAATGVTPPALAAASGLPIGPDGGLAVNDSLNVLGYKDIFGAGDSIWFTPRPLQKVGVYAVRQSGVLRENVLERLRRGKRARMRRFRAQRNYVLILNLGGGVALFSRKILGIRFTVFGRWMWKLKDRIDRSFMGRYGSEREWAQERNESS